jgi:hypothetical protein
MVSLLDSLLEEIVFEVKAARCETRDSLEKPHPQHYKQIAR